MPFISTKDRRCRASANVYGSNQPIIGAGAGTGISAKFAERGGVDLIIIYNSGRYRMAGRGSLAGLLPYGDANAIVVDMAQEVLPVVRDTPVLAGVCGTDPFRLMPVFLRELKAMGFDGVQNFPTVGLIDGVFRAEPRGDRHGLRPRGRDDPRGARARSADLPVRLRRRQREGDGQGRRRRAGRPPGPHDQGLDRRQDGADARRVGARGSRRCTTPRARCGRTSSCCATAGRSPSPRTPSTCWRTRTGIAGFFGASSIERLATESGIEAQARRFRDMKMPAPRAGDARREGAKR